MMSTSNVLLTDSPLDSQSITQLVAKPEQGGLVLFTGNVRNKTQGKSVLRLEYEAYEPMAISEMEKIRQTVLQKWPKARIAIHHRVGILEIGEAAVLIAVSTPHRAQAFEACQFAIDTLKEQVPIWKKEIFEDGEVWVAAHP